MNLLYMDMYGGKFTGKCTGLNTEWTSTMKTTTVFPVDPGTVLGVTCTYPDAVNEGSSEVTCKSFSNFTYPTESSCEIPGLC